MKRLELISVLIFLLSLGQTVFAQPIKVPILMYHHVGDRSKSSYNIALQEFVYQMDYLKTNNYETVSIDQIAAALRGEIKLPSKPVALTFDDGYKCGLIRVLPVLKSYSFRGTFFIIAGYADGYLAYLSWDEIKELHDFGMWIGSHTFTHLHLKQLNVGVLKQEIEKSKTVVEKHIGEAVAVFAYPYGEYNPQVLRIVQGSGYTAAVAVGGPDILHDSNEIYQLSRIPIYPKMTLKRFMSALEKIR